MYRFCDTHFQKNPNHFQHGVRWWDIPHQTVIPVLATTRREVFNYRLRG